MCYKCYNESISLITRLALNEFQASCYSHHRSQSALSETNWLLRVSGCDPYLESLPSYIDGAPPWTPTNRDHGITSRPLKHDPKVPPRDFKELRTDSIPIIYTNSQAIIHTSCLEILIPTSVTNPHLSQVESMPTRYSQPYIKYFLSHQYHVILIPTISLKSHAKIYPDSSFTTHTHPYSCKSTHS